MRFMYVIWCLNYSIYIPSLFIQCCRQSTDAYVYISRLCLLRKPRALIIWDYSIILCYLKLVWTIFRSGRVWFANNVIMSKLFVFLLIALLFLGKFRRFFFKKRTWDIECYGRINLGRFNGQIHARAILRYTSDIISLLLPYHML